MSILKPTPPFILGTMRWDGLSVSEAARLLCAAVDMGVNAFDLADIYGGYTVERLFGRALHESGVAREDIRIISKCAIVLPKNQQIKHYNTSREYIEACVVRSLEQIGVDYLDTLLIHRPSPLMDLNDLAATLAQLLVSGQVKSVGVSNFDIYAFEQLNALISLETNQTELSLSRPQALFDNTLLQLRTLKKSIQLWSPLGCYWRSDAVYAAQNKRIAVVLNELCRRYQVTESQMLIAWVRHRQSQASVVLGSTQIERVHSMIKAAHIVLTDADWYALLEASRGHDVA